VSDTEPYAVLLLVVAVVGVAAVLSNRLSERIHIPAPALFLAAAALLGAAIPSVHAPAEQTVERIVTVALLCILFDGGMHIGLHRFRTAAGPILWVGIVGTFLTTAALAVLAHLAFGFSWYVAVLLGTALAPTDPAVVFSVLGRHEIAGRAGTILEGESGANDPVGIALLISLITAGGLGAGTLAHVAGEFALQMGVGAAAGIIGGYALLWFMRRIALPSEGLYLVRTLACMLILYGATTLAHGSGFLAVFVAGIVIGDERAPFKLEVERFHSALASLGEIVAFVVLGLTVNLHELFRANVLVPGLILGLALTLVIRPLCVGPFLLTARLRRSESAFVLFAGLKGAVPILLGSLILAAEVPGAERLYVIIFVVVIFSVVVQGGLVPTVADALDLPTRVVDPQPFSLGIRLAEEPEDVIRLNVAPGSDADGATVDAVADVAGEVWINLLVRNQRLHAVRGSTTLQAGDEVLITAEERLHSQLQSLFGQ
jgi:cell volume regulation protein A